MGKNKLSALLLSIVVSFSLWLYVINNVSQQDTATISGIPVTLVGESLMNERNLMVTAVSSKTVSIRLSGTRSDLAKVNAGNIIVKADLSQIEEPGDRHLVEYKLSFPGDVPSNAFVVESKNPGSLYVGVDYRRTKEIPVTVKWTGTRSGNYLYDTENAVLDYPTVTIVGPAAIADQIEKAVIEVDLSQRQSSLSESFRYTLCDKNGEPVDAQMISTNVEEVRVDLQIQRIKDVKLAVDLIYGGGANEHNTVVKLDTDTIRVSGGEAVLKDLGDTLTIATINLGELEKGMEQAYPINLPEGVTNQTGVSEVMVSVRFSGLRTKEFEIENIQSINVPAGMEVEIISTKLTVKVRGSEEEINKLTDKNIFAVVDFTNAEAGNATYKAAITFSEEFKTVGALKTHSVSATVQPKGE